MNVALKLISFLIGPLLPKLLKKLKCPTYFLRYEYILCDVLQFDIISTILVKDSNHFYFLFDR